MENACTQCYDLVLHRKSHQNLKKISELKDSELYKCRACHAYLHKHNGDWEIISGGDTGEAAKPETEKKAEKIITIDIDSTLPPISSRHYQHS